MNVDATSTGPVRQPCVAGRFYGGDPDALEREIQGYLAASAEHLSPCAGSFPIGMMLPHAGYMFSGRVAGLTLGQVELEGSVFILGPSHTGQGEKLAVWPGGSWVTPLGSVPVDKNLAEALINSNAGFKADTRAHQQDHCLEVLVPLLQVKSPKSSIVPVIVREYNLAALERAGKALAAIIRHETENGRKAVMVASSDMSHYLPHEEGQRQDRLALEHVKALDPEGLYATVTSQRISMCGFAPVSMMLFATREFGASRCCVTAHTSSGITGKAFGASMDQVVGYAGAIVV